MIRIVRHWVPAVIALSVILLTLSIAACGGGEEDRDDVPTATADGETSAATSPTTDSYGRTPASAPPTATPDGEPPSTSAVTLDDYLRNVCGETVTEVGSWEEGDSLRELSEGLGFVSEQMSALEPPAEVSEWHNAQISFAEAFKEAIDDFLEDPGDRTEDEFLVSMFLTIGPHFESVEQTIAGMDAEIRTRMAEAGCIEFDEEPVGVIPSEDTGPAQPESEEITAGSSVAGSLDEPEETDRFHLQVDAGEYYLIEVAWQGMRPRELEPVFSLPDYNWTFNSEISPISERWTPGVSGIVSISVSAWDATGAYTLSISADSSPGIPANVRVSWEGSGARLTWDPVPGAEYYNVYHDSFSLARCSIDQDGNPSRCENLASNVTETSYLHTSPSSDDNNYWVAACSSDGCSEVDTENPATLTVDQPGGPISGGPCRKVLDMDPGDSCTVTGQTGPSIFEVRDGEACYGDICGEDSIALEEFLAYANFDRQLVFINRLPGVPKRRDSTPSPAPTRETNQ